MRRDLAGRSPVARFAVLSLLLGAGITLAAEPQEWLERMNKALTTRNYVGVFTHVRGTRAETLRIIHRVRGRDVSERLLSLDGSGREFIREGDELTCYFPDTRSASWSGALPTVRCWVHCPPSTMTASWFTKSRAESASVCSVAPRAWSR